MIKRPVKRYSRSGKDYLPKSGRAIKSKDKFAISVGGFSFTFSHNFNDWHELTEVAKQNCVNETMAFISKAIRHIGEEAIKRCPHFSGNLERSIKVTIPEVTSLKSRGKIAAYVGVLPSWKSTYDKFLIKLSEATGEAYPMSSVQLLAYIHEAYDQFIGSAKQGMRRKRRKESLNGGVRVGSHFLHRAWYDSANSNHIVDGFAKRLKSNLLANVHTEYSSQEEVNQDLSIYASTFDYIDEFEKE